MKKIWSVVLTSMLLALGASGAAQKDFFAGAGTTESNLSYYVVSGNGSGNPVINFLSVKTDKDAGVVTFYTLTPQSAVSSATVSGTAFITNVVTTNWIDTADAKIVIRDVSADVYQFSEIMIATTNTAYNQITLTNTAAAAADTLNFSLEAGDLIYEATAAGTLQISDLSAAYSANAATDYSNASGVYAGSKGVPLLVIVDGTTNHTISVISGEYR